MAHDVMMNEQWVLIYLLLRRRGKESAGAEEEEQLFPIPWQES